MTRSEAINVMRIGAKVTHRLFDENETVTIDNGYYRTEDGELQTPVEFWAVRKSPAWDDDWEIHDALSFFTKTK